MKKIFLLRFILEISQKLSHTHTHARSCFFEKDYYHKKKVSFFYCIPNVADLWIVIMIVGPQKENQSLFAKIKITIVSCHSYK
jgi:hypothetical protein